MQTLLNLTRLSINARTMPRFHERTGKKSRRKFRQRPRGNQPRKLPRWKTCQRLLYPRFLVSSRMVAHFRPQGGASSPRATMPGQTKEIKGTQIFRRSPWWLIYPCQSSSTRNARQKDVSRRNHTGRQFRLSQCRGRQEAGSNRIFQRKSAPSPISHQSGSDLSRQLCQPLIPAFSSLWRRQLSRPSRKHPLLPLLALRGVRAKCGWWSCLSCC